MISAKWWRPVRKPLIAFAWLLVVFAAGVGIYFVTLVAWPLLLVWWPPLLAGAAGIIALGAWWLWWRLPKRQVERQKLTIRDAKARADVEDNIRKTIGQLLGGVAVLLGAGFAYLQFTQQQETSHRQLDATVEQAKQQREAAQALLISNQVAKGFELLGNKDDKVQQRLGGIYALEGVMNASKDYHQPVLEALCAFVRDGTTEGREPPTSDIQAALTVIGRRAAGDGRPDLNNAHIPKADLPRADLNGADLSDANLGHANLSGAHLHGADLTSADLSDADLSDALLWADLSDANLSGANLSGANLIGANLHGAKLEFANLISADLKRAHLEFALLTGANLSGAKNLTKEQLDQACGTGVHGLDKLDPVPTLKPCLEPPAR